MAGLKAEQSQCLILQTKVHPLIVYEVSWHWAGLREGKGSPHHEGRDTKETGCVTASKRWMTSWWSSGPLLVSLCGHF